AQPAARNGASLLDRPRLDVGPPSRLRRYSPSKAGGEIQTAAEGGCYASSLSYRSRSSAPKQTKRMRSSASGCSSTHSRTAATAVVAARSLGNPYTPVEMAGNDTDLHPCAMAWSSELR